MLVRGLKLDEPIYIGDQILVVGSRGRKNRLQICIDAPREIPITLQKPPRPLTTCDELTGEGERAAVTDA